MDNEALEAICRVQAKLIKIMEGELAVLKEQVGHIQAQTNIHEDTIYYLEDRNEYGMNERQAHAMWQAINVLRYGDDEKRWSKWKPWPLCHCQLDPGSESVQALRTTYDINSKDDWYYEGQW